MASNSDSIFFVLSFIRRHPDQVFFSRLTYTNSLTIVLPGSTKVADADIYFLPDQLTVNRLADEFVAKHGDLLDYFNNKLENSVPDYMDVWVTTTYLTHHDKYLIELSFEQDI
ncbi:hypothetical protein [Dellaglioa algida]|uniref:Uncharacterized protein n=1 Tax=Dellaglioa algida TaxID=105612 RepID=A0A2C8EN42_9LACO|nr:hypothetical protein [Dellaglioa algida]MDK1716856.1 hypothetical protein [Dellaglioa algida]MDK1719219.1 hypothetical protein [Dellaglioa algida]MDK1719630.1 hypothetical protein [Dellaglioa algida]MDK1721909.1 hypothetical protein [Dellaglioa algida]MDK1722973.1 hypothetical protein [Dellaglioa algida]